MNDSVLKLPFGNKKVLYGKNAQEYLIPELLSRNLKHAFICTDKGLGGTPMFQNFAQTLEDGGIKTTFFFDIQPNPSVENVEKGRRALLKSACDCVVGFGGGSSLDAAKMIAALAANEGNIMEYTSHYTGMKQFKLKNYYTIGIPTTAGTGSEMDNCACVVGDTGRKQNVFSDVCALKSIDLAMKNLENAYESRGPRYCDNMAMASFLSGFILTVGVGAKSVPIHSISLPLSMRYHLSHGESLAAVLPYVLDEIIGVLPAPIAGIGRYVGIQETDMHRCAKLFCIRLQQMIRALDLEMKVERKVENKADKEAIRQMAETAILSKTTTDNEILPCDFEKCCAIYTRMFQRETIQMA